MSVQAESQTAGNSNNMKRKKINKYGVSIIHQNLIELIDEYETALASELCGCGESPTRPSSEIMADMQALEKAVIEKRKDAFYFPLIDYRWHGMFTLRFEASPFGSDTDGGRQSRKRFIRRLMGYLLRKWKLSKRDCNWVAATEISLNGNVHVHLIFNFSPVEYKNIRLPEHHEIEHDLPNAIEWLCENWAENVVELEANALKILDQRYGLTPEELPEKTKIAIKRHASKGAISPNGIDAHYSAQYLNCGLVAYVCKLADGESQKHFEWSTPITKWKHSQRKEAA